MKRYTSIIITSLVAAGLAIAHGGFDHVQGTVMTVAKNVLTVKTAKGNSNVKLDAKTEFTKDDKPATLQDLLPGMRVVVDIPEGDKTMTAHSVKIGAAAKAATKTKATDDHHDHK